jgi:hypothetical protein
MAVSAATVSAGIPSFKKKGVVRVRTEARAVERRLRIEAIVQHGAEYLDVSPGLHEPAHDTLYTMQRAVRIGGQAGDDGVVWAFTGPGTVGVVRHQRKVAPPVLEDKAEALGYDAAAEV